MGTTQQYKNTSSHRSRYMTTVGNFSKGIKYTDNPLEDGYAKLMVNYNFKNDGEVLTPRGGLHTIAECAVDNTSGMYTDYIVLATGTMYVDHYGSLDATLCRYILIGNPTSAGITPDNCKLCISKDLNDYSTSITAEVRTGQSDGVYTGYLVTRESRNAIHGVQMNTNYCRDCVYTSLEGIPYFRVGDNLCSIYAQFNADQTEVEWYFQNVTPKEVQPAQAMNYGYNMLKSNPYSFENVETATGEIQLTGVVPYDSEGNLLLSARAGTEITFKLFYKYPHADLQDKYRVQWELQEQDSGADSIILQSWKNSAEYDVGDDITFTFTPTYQSFTMIVSVYRVSSIEDQQDYWDTNTNLQSLIDRDEYVTADAVTTLASYNLTNDSNSSTIGVEAVTYNLATATGCCTWQHRLVLWGVQGCKETLWVSEINDPSYFPYPNNAEITDDPIISCVPYLNKLLVFTQTSLYQITLNDDGLSYTTEKLQQRLNLLQEDVDSVVVVQNMVFFKSDNYYYLVTPSYDSVGNLSMRIAPISRPVEYLLDNFAESFENILQRVYGFSDKLDCALEDYWTYLDGNQVRINYKYKVIDTGYGRNRTSYIDYVLNYDTVLRAWTIYMYASSPYRMKMYVSTQTGQSLFIHTYTRGIHAHYVVVQFDPKHPADELVTGLSMFSASAFDITNVQYINTGTRDFATEVKKRFREVQFFVNIPDGTQLHFNTGFNCDGDEVKQLYGYEVTSCTDVNDPMYGQVWIVPKLEDSTDTELYTQFDSFILDGDMFPYSPVVKVRYNCTCKGYTGSAQILCTDDEYYELLNVNFVYRAMFAR